MKAKNQKAKAATKRNLTSADLIQGFEVVARNNFDSEYEKMKRRLGVAVGERLVIRWK